ncbi:permease [Simiduia curdlanivorans]|uniref:Permease n=1 Tax=Simiduia curdlanivorans TaxID=1492769 RepID=A0ABV8V7L2_9GAMM|nr:permease [Simiduia curdlanivorans]MDN3639786.1 permease [Simiduia curdlanivorans]
MSVDKSCCADQARRDQSSSEASKSELAKANARASDKSASCCGSSATNSKPDQSEGQATAGSCCPSDVEHSHGRVDYLLWGGLFLISLLYGLSLSSVVGVDHDAALSIAAHTVYELINTMWWGVLLAALFVGLLAVVPQTLILGLLGQGGSKTGVIRATAAGLLLDLCSHGVLMVGMQLYKRGASLGQVMAFLIATPWNSLSLTIIMVALIGLQWTLCFIFFSLLIALVTGFWIDSLVTKGKLASNPNHMELPADYRWRTEFAQAWRRIEWRFGLIPELLWGGLKGSAMVIRWLFVGVLLAAAVRAFVDVSVFAQWFGPSLLGLAVTLVAATIIEVCSEGSTPLAAELVTRASAPGNAFTFMMAGVSTDYTEIMSLKDTTQSWRLALALPLYTLPQILLVGWLLNTLS